MAQFPDIIAVTCSKKKIVHKKNQIIIAWFGIGKLAEVIKTNLDDQYN